eukprot:m.8208 g.8208  ORF g.8208 m.8208 type:complete len:320 (+) comp5064_c0_seq1:1060-2019(+)
MSDRAVAFCSSSFRLRDVHVLTIMPKSERQVDALRFINENHLLVSLSRLSGRVWDGTIRIFDCDMAVVASAHSPVSIADLQVLGEHRFMSGGDDGQVAVWVQHGDGTLEKVLEKTEHDQLVSALSICADRVSAVSASYDNSLKLWSVLPDELRSTTTFTGHTRAVTGVASHSSKPQFLSTSRDGQALVWSTQQRTPVHRLLCASEPTAVTWHPSAEHVFSLGFYNGTVCTKDLRNLGDCVRTWNAHEAQITDLAYAPQGKHANFLATASHDCAVKVFTDSSLVYSALHEYFSSRVAWSPSGQYLCSGGWDGEIQTHKLE